MCQSTKMAFKNALLLGFLQSAKTSNLWALLTRSENAPLGNMFTSLSVIMIPNLHVKDHFNWPSRISPRGMWICLSFRLNLLRPQRENRMQFYFLLDFSKLKTLGQVLDLFFENSLPKGFSWQNMKKFVISVLKINSRYLQSSGLKNDFKLARFTFDLVQKFEAVPRNRPRTRQTHNRDIINILLTSSSRSVL